MASEGKQTKSETAPKKDATAKVASAAAEAVPKDAAKDAAKDAPKSGGGETAGAAPASYSRGEGQKPVTAAYKENWNAIFANKKKNTKKRAKKKKR
jgi:hypothetical protein